MMPSAKIAMRPDRAAGQHVEHVQQCRPAADCSWLRQLRRVDAGHRDVGAQPRHDQRAQREHDALAQLRRLGEGSEIEIRGQLFGC